MIRRHTRRPGTSLMEVLIAMGILAIGMLAIMALFPIGAVNMARAINQNRAAEDRKSTRLNSSHVEISYAVFCLKKKKKQKHQQQINKNIITHHDVSHISFNLKCNHTSRLTFHILI